MATLVPEDDPLPEAVGLCRDAAEAGLPLRLLGGLAVRVLCPDFPPRLRAGQDIDLACLAKGRKKVAAHLAEHGCQPDRAFNGLNGDRQLYFTAPSGRPVDVMVDRLAMCHTLDFRPGFGRLPLTLDGADLLLSKLQIVELNAKDAHDIVHLLAGLPVGDGPGSAEAPAIDSGRFGQVLADGHRQPGQAARRRRRPAGAGAAEPAVRPDRPGQGADRDGGSGPENHEMADPGPARRAGPVVRAA
jgi:hypothetical protein